MRVGNQEKEEIRKKEKHYSEIIFQTLSKYAIDIARQYNEANLVQKTWWLQLEPGNPPTIRKIKEIWKQLGENIITSFIQKQFPHWLPAGVPIGSDIRLSTNDAVIHIDAKSIWEEDQEVMTKIEVRPEQISGNGRVDDRGLLVNSMIENGVERASSLWSIRFVRPHIGHFTSFVMDFPKARERAIYAKYLSIERIFS